MKTTMTLAAVLFSLGVALGPAQASPGDTGGEESNLAILEVPMTACPGQGNLCLTAGDSHTGAAPAAPPAGLDGYAAESTVPRFRRMPPNPADAGPAQIDDSVPWTIDLNATLRQHALAGNALFLVYDAESPTALAAHEVTAMWQAPIAAGNRVSVRLTLSPEDGFHANHQYHILVAQIVQGKEVVLADGQVTLL